MNSVDIHQYEFLLPISKKLTTFMMQQNIDVTNIILYNALREHLGKTCF